MRFGGGGAVAVHMPGRPPDATPPLPAARVRAAAAVKRKTRKALGRVMLKGDTITLMQAAK